jgi:GlpG protein
MVGRSKKTPKVSGMTQVIDNKDKTLMKALRSAKKYYIVWLIIGLSCIPYFILQQQGLEGISQWFLPANASELFSPFSPWRLWTPTFVHYTLTHLVINLYLWWLFASKVEKESRLELIILVVFSAAGANLLQWWLEGPNFGGLLGVVYALMAYLYLMHRFTGKTNYKINPIFCLLMLSPIPLSAVGVIVNLANFTFFGGLVSGALLAGIYLGIIAFISNTTPQDKKEEHVE